MDFSNRGRLRVHTRRPTDKLIKRRQWSRKQTSYKQSSGKNKPLHAGPRDGQRPYSLTCFFWPILCARACACKSFWGFQSESKMTTVSAEARLIPRPPARVESRKQKSCTQCNILLYAVAFSETLSQSNKPSHLESPAGVKKSEIWWTNLTEAKRSSRTWDTGDFHLIKRSVSAGNKEEK